jgi:hypothetical protein
VVDGSEENIILSKEVQVRLKSQQPTAISSDPSVVYHNKNSPSHQPFFHTTAVILLFFPRSE